MEQPPQGLQSCDQFVSLNQRTVHDDFKNKDTFGLHVVIKQRTHRWT